jgi:hypothetical protein
MNGSPTLCRKPLRCSEAFPFGRSSGSLPVECFPRSVSGAGSSFLPSAFLSLSRDLQKLRILRLARSR